MERQQIASCGLRGWLHQNRHAWCSLYLIPILLCYFLPELLVVSDYTPTEISLDASIPFLPGFVYFYILWFAMLVGTGLWLLLRDGNGFRKYMYFLTASYFVCAVIYLCFPNGQDLRPAQMEVNSLATWILSKLYRIDTNTNVFPSLHVIGSVGVALAVCTTPSIRSRLVRGGSIVLATLVSVSTVFVKQHAVLDVVAGAIFGFGLYLLVCLLFQKRSAKYKK